MKPQCASASPDWYPILKQNARRLRREMTPAESVLWNELRAGRLGFKFRRQHVIGDYIVDFVCLKQRLVVELDGEYHTEPTQIKQDKLRTEALERMGFRVIRFANNQVCNQLSDVLRQIEQQLTNK